MDVILAIFPEPVRLYEATLNGIRRRIARLYELQTIDYDIDKPRIRQLLNFWRPVGCIHVCPKGIGQLTPAAFGKTPVVYLDRSPLSGGNHLDVTQDYEQGALAAARELIQPEIQNYAFVGHNTPTSWSQARGCAFADTIRLHGKTCHIFDRTNSDGAWFESLEHWLVGLPKPVGVFAANDRTALDVHAICKRNQIAIPNDVALLGIDNIPEICENVDPKISSISSDFELAGWTCADLLLERLSKPHMRRALRKYPVLGVITRASTQKTSGFSRRILRAVNVIRARACEGLTVEEVAIDMGCSRRMAEIAFRKATGSTIICAITDARLERAKVLLKDRSMPLASVVSACGYGTENALRIAFRKKFGLSLREGRERLTVRRSAGT